MESPCKKKRFVSHGGDVWGFARKNNIPLDQVLDFSAPTNHLGPCAEAVKAIEKAAKLVKFYPDPNPTELKKEIAEYVGKVDPENIIMGNGSIELIYLLPEFLGTDFEGIIPVPSFTEYEKAILRTHSDIVFVKLASDFSLNVYDIEKAITERTKIVYVCNPHSPSGTLYRKETILKLVEVCHNNDVVVAIDENYIEFVKSSRDVTMAPFVEEFDNLFVIRSVTKFYGMPGVRFGYGVASKKFICALDDVRMPWNINSLAVFATMAALKDTEFIEQTMKAIASEKEQLTKLLGEISSLQVVPSETNFLLLKILGHKITSTRLREEMAKRGILIRDCSTFVGLDDSYFRITVRSPEENIKLVETLKKALVSV
jgi:threonine-phosphate decarboxylase